jgi:hypothetical protein
MVLKNQIVYGQMFQLGVTQAIGAVGLATIFEKMCAHSGFVEARDGKSIFVGGLTCKDQVCSHPGHWLIIR